MVFLVQRMVIFELPTVEMGVFGLLMKQSLGKGNPSPSMRLKKYSLCCCSLNAATPAYVVLVTECLAVVMVPMGTSVCIVGEWIW